MKFVGCIKGRHYLIDPETYESELREKIAKEIEDSYDMPPIDEIDHAIYNALQTAASIARGALTNQ